MNQTERGPAEPAGLDTAQILRSAGEAAYEWRIDHDVLIWSTNASDVIGVDASQIGTGRAWAQQIDPHSGHNRYDAIHRSGQRDDGSGVPYRVSYALRRPDGEPKVWVEDVGRWRAGPDGTPQRAEGIVRIVTEQHEQIAMLERLAYYDHLTGEMNRARLTQTLEAVLDE